MQQKKSKLRLPVNLKFFGEGDVDPAELTPNDDPESGSQAEQSEPDEPPEKTYTKKELEQEADNRAQRV